MMRSNSLLLSKRGFSSEAGGGVARRVVIPGMKGVLMASGGVLWIGMLVGMYDERLLMPEGVEIAEDTYTNEELIISPNML